MAAVGKPAIFISYKRGHDASLALVAELEAALSRQGFVVWRDVGIEAGEPWPEELWRWLQECNGAVALICDEAVESDWCRREWSVLAARFSHTELRVVPVHVGRVSPQAGDILTDLQAIRFDEQGTVEAVIERLQGLRAAPPRAADFLAAHAAWVRWLYAGAPALGREPFTLADVYVGTECGRLTWDDLRNNRSIDPFAEEHGGRADLLDSVLGYFGDPNFREPVVVQGPAGSGKSAFTVRLANRLLDENAGLMPVIVRFRDLRLSRYSDVDELLKDAVRVAPADEHPPAPAEPLFGSDMLADTTTFRQAEISRVVVILDGWDEVTLTGNTRFKQQIEEWLPRLRSQFIRNAGPPTRLLLTGRPSAAIDRSNFLHGRTPVLTIRPIRPDQLRTYAARISDHLADDASAGWQLDVSRCALAFARYEAWFSRTRRPPEPSGGADDTDVLGSPLLALLTFRTVAEQPAEIGDLFAEPTGLYNALIDVTTRHSGRAEPSPDGTVHRGGPTLRRLLQRVAAIITTQGSESVSFDELDRRLAGDTALARWAEAATSEGTLHELVVNFYFKGHPELGCEFLHKSFREYLHAEAIVAALEEVAAGRSGPHPPPEREDWGTDFLPGSAHHAASRALTDLLAPQWLTPEVRTHLSWLIRRAVAANPALWAWLRDVLNDLWRWWVEGAHVRTHPGPQRWRQERLPPPVVDMIDNALPRDDRPWLQSPSTVDLDAHLGDALLQLSAFVHAQLPEHPKKGRRAFQSDHGGIVRFRPFDYDPANLIARIAASRHRPRGPGLVGAWLPAIDLTGADLVRANLADAVLADAVLARAILAEAILARASLAHADLFGADLFGADLFGATLIGATLIDANLAHANLDRADLIGANLSDANLARASLFGANLAQANLDRADLFGADLFDADLFDANLARASLFGANLARVGLGGADLTGANLSGANLTGANLTGANLTGANLTDANLTDVNLTRADLTRADLTRAGLANVTYDRTTKWPRGFKPPPAAA